MKKKLNIKIDKIDFSRNAPTILPSFSISMHHFDVNGMYYYKRIFGGGKSTHRIALGIWRSLYTFPLCLFEFMHIWYDLGAFPIKLPAREETLVEVKILNWNEISAGRTPNVMSCATFTSLEIYWQRIENIKMARIRFYAQSRYYLQCIERHTYMYAKSRFAGYQQWE